MGGLSRLRRYVIRVDAYLDDMSLMANSTISFLTGENDGGKGEGHTLWKPRLWKVYLS